MRSGNLGIVVNERKTASFPLVRQQIELMQQAGWRVALAAGTPRPHRGIDTRPFPRLATWADFILSFGGDGTLLSVARRLGRQGTPVIGVNTGGLGFLTSLGIEELPAALQDLRQGRYRVEERMMLHIAVRRPGRPGRHLTALNDLVVHRGRISRLIRVNVAAGREHINTYFADGLIVATPTGSTAYSLSAGAPIVHPRTRVFVVTPICPHSLSERPMVLSADEELRLGIEPGQPHCTLTVDGQVGYPLTARDTVVVTREKFPARLVVFPGHSFYAVLRNKLHWGVRRGKSGTGVI
jgi:NAD+ kinase